MSKAVMKKMITVMNVFPAASLFKYMLARVFLPIS